MEPGRATARVFLWARRIGRYGAIHMSELSGQVAIVTGGASGIGAASVELLAQAGATVIVGRHPAARRRRRPLRAARRHVGGGLDRRCWPTCSAARAGSTSWSTMPASRAAGARSRAPTVEQLAPGRGDQFRGRVPRLQVRHRGHEADRRRTSLRPRARSSTSPRSRRLIGLGAGRPPTARARARCGCSARAWRSIAPRRSTASAATRCIRAASTRRSSIRCGR